MCSGCQSDLTDRRFKFQKRRQLFIGSHNKALTVAMCADVAPEFVFDCRMADDPAMMSSTNNLDTPPAKPPRDCLGLHNEHPCETQDLQSATAQSAMPLFANSIVAIGAQLAASRCRTTSWRSCRRSLEHPWSSQILCLSQLLTVLSGYLSGERLLPISREIFGRSSRENDRAEYVSSLAQIAPETPFFNNRFTNGV